MAKRKGKPSPRTVTIGLRAKAWWVLRKNKSMTLAEIMLTVCDGSEKNAESNLRGWLNKLSCAGMLTRRREPDGKLTSNGSYRYTLVKDLGPKAPVVRALAKQVFDPNSGKTVSYSVNGNDHD
jgi:hypothetical protein